MKILKIVTIIFLNMLLISGCGFTTEDAEGLNQNSNRVETEVGQEQIEDVQNTKAIMLEHLHESMASSPQGNLDIQENPNGSYVCGIDYESNHIVVLNAANEIVLDAVLRSPMDEGLNLSFYAWGDQQEWLWLIHNRTHQVKDFVRIDLITGDVSYFEQNYGFSTDFSLEPDTGDLCFSDFPIILDIDERQTFLASDHKITLSLVNLLTESTPQVIETSINRAFDPRWVEPYIFTYNNPYLGIDEIEQVTYAFNQPFELVSELTEPITYETHEEFKEKYNYIRKVLIESGDVATELVNLYGYVIPIKDILLFDESNEIINQNGLVQCFSDRDGFLLFIDDRQSKDLTRLENFLGLKYAEDTVGWLMEMFMKDDSYIIFQDGSYIQVSQTTAGFKSVHIGYIQ